MMMVRSGPQCFEGDIGEPLEPAGESGPLAATVADCRLAPTGVFPPSREDEDWRSSKRSKIYYKF